MAYTGPQPTAGAPTTTAPAVEASSGTGTMEPVPQFPTTPNPSGDKSDTAAATSSSSDTQAGILTPQAKTPPSTQGDINSILEPYINELTNLGPEYNAEMEFLKPYLTQTGSQAPQSFAGLESASTADESPTGSKTVNEADESVGNAIESEQAPGFGSLASAAKDYEGTLPYSDILQTVLGAGKNEILYGTTPNISSISTAGWPSSLQDAYGYLTQAATGTNANTALPSPAAAATQAAAQQQASQQTTNPSVQGGGNVG